MTINFWHLVAAIPPLLIWAGLFLYLKKVQDQLKDIKRTLGQGFHKDL